MGVVELVVGGVVVIAILSFFAGRLVQSKRHQAWLDREDEMMETVTEHRIRRNFMQGGG